MPRPSSPDRTSNNATRLANNFVGIWISRFTAASFGVLTGSLASKAIESYAQGDKARAVAYGLIAVSTSTSSIIGKGLVGLSMR